METLNLVEIALTSMCHFWLKAENCLYTFVCGVCKSVNGKIFANIIVECTTCKENFLCFAITGQVKTHGARLLLVSIIFFRCLDARYA